MILIEFMKCFVQITPIVELFYSKVLELTEFWTFTLSFLLVKNMHIIALTV